MKHFFVLALFLTASQSWALKPPSQQERVQIEQYLLNAKMVETRPGGLAQLNKDLNDPTQQLNRSAHRTALLKKGIAALERERDLERDKAIHLTVVAYGILAAEPSGRPNLPSGEIILPGRYKGKQGLWIPISNDNEERWAQEKNGDSHREAPAEPNKRMGHLPAGRTTGDGITVILPNAFLSPGILALTLLHEHRHFQQFITPGQGNSLTHAEMEVEAYELEAAIISDLKNPMGLLPGEKKFMEDLLYGNVGGNGERRGGTLDYWQGRKKDEKWSLNWMKARSGLGDPSSADKEGLPPPRTDGEVAAINKRFDDLSQIVSDELDAVRKEREESLDPHLRFRRFVDALENAAAKYCADPGSVTDEELASLSKTRPKYCASSLPEGQNRKNCAFNLFNSMCGRILEGLPLEAVSISAEANKMKMNERIDRHRTLLLRFAGRSCASPGSVSQNELDELKGFYDPYETVHLTPLPPGGENDCLNSLHDLLLRRVRNGNVPDADWLRSWAMSSRQFPRSTPPRPPLFASTLAGLAQAACSKPGFLAQQDVDQWLSNLYPNRAIDGVDEARQGLAGCARALFDMLLDDNGKRPEGQGLNAGWVNSHSKELAEKFKPHPVDNQPDPDQKPQKGNPGKGDGGPCGDGGSGCGRSRPTMPRH